LHHATATNLDEVFFVIANECRPIYSVRISFMAEHRSTFLAILFGIYDKSLSWAYSHAWERDNPTDYIPMFREDVISKPSYHIDRDTVVYQYALWKNLLRASRDAGMPLPVAKRIVPAIVAFWNKGKGRIDEMSRYLKELHWYLAQELPRQALIIREIKKVSVNAFLLKKHCFNSLPKTWFQGKSFSAIRKKLAQHGGTLSDFVLELARTYKIISPMPGVLPTSPLKRKRESFEDAENQQSSTPVSQLAGEERSPRQRMAEIYCSKVKLNKMKKFTKDTMLNRIRLDRSLNHTALYGLE
jgi:hypothetical protein